MIHSSTPKEAHMLTCKVSTQDPTFCALTKALDKELALRYGTLQSHYDAHNVVEHMETAVVGFVEEEGVACGCFKPIDTTTVEIKRMFVAPNHRRKGYSSALLEELEVWARALGFTYARLETGKGQPEAIALYQKHGYTITSNFPPYVGMDNSVCMHKPLYM